MYGSDTPSIQPLVPAWASRSVTAALLLLVALTHSGCVAFAVLAEGIAGGEQTVTVEAEYEGLAGQRIAVLVAADEYTLYQHPEVPDQMMRGIAGQIASHIPGTQFLNPATVTEFQKQNPFWASMPYGDLLDRFNADRIVVVELSEYRLHEPGNAHQWQGAAGATVEVYSNTQADPDDAVFRSNVRSMYPQDRLISVVNADGETIKLGLLAQFSAEVSRLFYEHTITQ